ncbi:MAG: VWA domain-containing protein [Lachnospiraceae bacterium]|nr:VWA domain-containing protein [Lachnospiraceae bacterium]
MNAMIWSVNVPENAYNITFNRYSPDKSTKWNSWSAGGRDNNNAYFVDGSEYGHWEIVTDGENYFHAGDIIYLDVSEFPEWKNDNALMYINFTNASKDENNGNDINISSANTNLYSPKLVDIELTESVYAYVVTLEDEGATELKFWRGNTSTLWNYSITLSYEDYLNGINCIKVISWNNNGNLITSENNIDFELDTDNDGIPDYYEIVYGLDKYNKDSDNDGLEDAQELYFTKSNPIKFDSLIEGTSDADVDNDDDGLTNIEELSLGTQPCNKDTDEDGLTDSEEINSSLTDPNNADTDGDSLSDSDDIALGFSPLLQDTDGNGILDCDEKIYQTLNIEIDNAEKTEVNKVSVSFEGTGYINSTTSIEDIYGKDIYVSETVGLVGVPIEINSSSEFDTATICFHLDEELGSEALSNLIIMWYDEDNDRYIEQETIVNEEAMTVSTVVNHFSKYMLVDNRDWFEAWKEEISYSNGTNYDVIIAIDCSGSMALNDPYFTYTYKNTLYPGSKYSINTCYRKLAAENFIYAQGEEDRTEIVLFSSYVSLYSSLSNDKSANIAVLDNIYSNGGTNYYNAIVTSVNLLIGTENDAKKMILFMSDGEASISDDALNYAIANDVVINTVYMGNTLENAVLKNIAEKTGGEYYKAVTAEELVDIYSKIAVKQKIENSDNDNDGDGIPDIFEMCGMRLSNGQVIYSDPTKPDTDGDGLLDGEEISVFPSYMFNTIYDQSGWPLKISAYIFLMRSNPNKKDSDGDALLDGTDIIINGDNKIAPKDTKPLQYNGPTGIWANHINQIKNGGNVAHYLTSWYNSDIITNTSKWNFHDFSAWFGARFLSFPADETGEIVHSHITNWQALFGYNIIYDCIFNLGTKGNMEAKTFPFVSDGKEYIIWAWKGDYLNLGAGAEIGIYQNLVYVPGLDLEYYTKHWVVPPLLTTMKLYLYNYYNIINIKNIFCWEPAEPQWWITGFSPSIKEPDADIMVSIGVIDFDGKEEMYEGLKNSLKGSFEEEYWIFDEDGHTAWFVWD